MDIDFYKKFCVIAEEKNFSKAADGLHISQSALSRSISQVEERLKFKLFHRSGKGLELTPKGFVFFEHAKSMMRSDERFLNRFCENEELMEGELTVGSFPYLGSQWLIPRIKEFRSKYPKLKLTIENDSERLKPYSYDVTLGVHVPDDPNLIQKRLFPDYNQFYSSREYLDKHGVPASVEELDKHNLITYGRQGSYSSYRSINLLMHLGRPGHLGSREPCLSVNCLSGMINAVLGGNGIAELPRFAAVHYKDLIPVLPRIRGKNIPIYFICQSNRKHSEKIKKFFDFLWSITEEERISALKENDSNLTA